MVISGQLVCPKYTEVKLRPCPLPPDKEVLIKFAQSAVGNKALGIDENHQPDKNWLLAVVSTYNPDCTIFKKSFMPPRRHQKVEVNAKVSLPADFLKDLPESRKKRKKRRLGMLRAGREEAKAERIKKLQDTYRKQVVLADNKSKTSAHSSKNKFLQIQQRKYTRQSLTSAPAQSASNSPPRHSGHQNPPASNSINTSSVNVSQQNPHTNSVMNSSSSSNSFLKAG
jgi:hypothetical protein